MTSGNTWSKIIPFSIPIMFSMFSQQLYNLVDTAIVGRFLGSIELGAVGNAGNIMMICYAVSGGIEIGSEIVFANFIGAKKYDKIGKSIIGILIFTLSVTMVFASIGLIFCKPIMDIMNVPPEMKAYTSAYMQIFLFGMWGIFLFDVSRTVLTSLGYSKITLFLVIFSSIVNVVLDLIFVCTLHMGVRGAALATVLAQTAGFVITFLISRAKLRELGTDYSISKECIPVVKEVLKLSGAPIIQQISICLSLTMLQAIINTFGAQIVSGYTICSKVTELMMMPSYGLISGLTVFVSQNYGAGKKDRIKEGYKVSLISSVILASVITIGARIFIKPIASIFIDISANRIAFEFIAMFMLWNIIACLLNSFRNINEAYARSLKRMDIFLVSNLCCLCTKLIVTWILSSHVGISAIIIGSIAGPVIGVLLSFRALKIKI